MITAIAMRKNDVTPIFFDLSNLADLVDLFLLVFPTQCADRGAGGVTTIEQSHIGGWDTV